MKLRMDIRVLYRILMANTLKSAHIQLGLPEILAVASVIGCASHQFLLQYVSGFVDTASHCSLFS